MGQVEGKAAIVTGGASGIGAACAKTLAREGARVVLTDIGTEAGEKLAARIRADGGDAIFLSQDVTDETRWPEIIAATLDRHKSLDIMVANAGIGISVPIVDMTMADWKRQTAINLDGVFMSVKSSIPAMARSGGGSIILMSSVAGLRGAAGLAGYCATKGGVRLFAKAAAMECAAGNTNIRVNSVHPGIIDTPIWGKIPTGAQGALSNAPIDPHAVSQLAVPLGRAGTAQDIANAVLFLASDASSYITGTEMIVDGGMTGGGVGRRPPETA